MLPEEGWQSLWHCAIMAGSLIFTSGRVIPMWWGGLYLRLGLGWQGSIMIIVWGRKTRVLLEYPEVGHERVGTRLTVMKRQRSLGDSELLASNTEDTTDQSEQEESSSLRSSWSLVSQSWQVPLSLRASAWGQRAYYTVSHLVFAVYWLFIYRSWA